MSADRCTCPHPSTCAYCSRMYPCRCEHCPYRSSPAKIPTSSRYHAFRQHNGRGWGVLHQNAVGSSEATVVAVDMPEDEARAMLRALRAEEPPSASETTP